MNIFYLSKDPRQAAEMHNDKHVVKMILESAQMLSTAARLNGVDQGYKITHQNHPCAKWVRESRWNYYWLREMVFWLHEEWRFRFGHPSDKYHKSFLVCKELPAEPEWLPDVDPTPVALAMPDEFRCDDPVTAYRQYYMGAKRDLAKWSKRGAPEWWK